MITIDIKNLDDFLKKFNSLQISKTFDVSLKKSIIFLEWEAKKETPVDKWFLRKSYKPTFWNLEGKLINERWYWVFVHEWHFQTPGRFVPAIWKRLVQSFIKWNPFLTRTAEKSAKKVNVIWNNEVEKMFNSLKK